MTIPPETVPIEGEKFYCDGNGDGVDAGHPRVFLTMTKAGFADCPYCGRHFVLVKSAGARANAH